MKSTYRLKVETLIKIAQTTTDAEWREQCLHEARDLLTDIGLKPDTAGIDDACELILGVLEKEKEVTVDGINALLGTSYSAWTIKRAKKKLKDNNLIGYRQDGFGGRWKVFLINQEITS